uniref:Uncharacterized protein n=1 Tax=Oryza meridionalis TaxID=40149 RepID=A0A0E0F2H6_9ORYZ
MLFYEEKEKEIKAAYSEALSDKDDEEKDGEICQLLGYEEEHGQVSAGMEDIPENHVKKGCTYASPEYLAELTQKILLEINVNEDLGNGNTVVSSGVMEGDEDKKTVKTGKVLCHEMKHARNEGGQVFEGELEHKKARMAESSQNKGEDEETLLPAC